MNVRSPLAITVATRKLSPLKLLTRVPRAGGFDRYRISEASGNRNTTATSRAPGSEGPSEVTDRIMSLDRVIRKGLDGSGGVSAWGEDAGRSWNHERAGIFPEFFESAGSVRTYEDRVECHPRRCLTARPLQIRVSALVGRSDAETGSSGVGSNVPTTIVASGRSNAIHGRRLPVGVLGESRPPRARVAVPGTALVEARGDRSARAAQRGGDPHVRRGAGVRWRVFEQRYGAGAAPSSRPE